jgi:hypothetical protein
MIERLNAQGVLKWHRYTAHFPPIGARSRGKDILKQHLCSLLEMGDEFHPGRDDPWWNDFAVANILRRRAPRKSQETYNRTHRELQRETIDEK